MTEAQIAEAEAIGVRFEPPYRDPKPKPPTRANFRESELLRRLAKLEPYFREHGHINVKQLYGIDGWPAAGRWITNLRGKYKQGVLPDSVIQRAEEMNIQWVMHSRRS